MRKTALILTLVSLISAGCATTRDSAEGDDPTLIGTTAPAEVAASLEEAAPAAEESSKQEEGEVPLAVAESEPEPPTEAPEKPPEEVIVQARRHQVIHDLVAEGQT